MTVVHGHQNAKASQIVRSALGEYFGNLGDQIGTRRQTHTSRPRGRRWIMGNVHHRTPYTLINVLVCMMLVLSTYCTSAETVYQGGQYHRRMAHARTFERDGEILFDRSPSPVANIQRRQVETDTPSKSTSLTRESFSSTASAIDKSATGSIVSPDSSTSSPAGSSPTGLVGVPISDSTLPKPFDGGIGTNYTQQSCPTFLRSMINNDTFMSCVPLSLLLQVSRTRGFKTLIAKSVRIRYRFSQPANPKSTSPIPSMHLVRLFCLHVVLS